MFSFEVLFEQKYTDESFQIVQINDQLTATSDIHHYIYLRKIDRKGKAEWMETKFVPINVSDDLEKAFTNFNKNHGA